MTEPNFSPFITWTEQYFYSSAFLLAYAGPKLQEKLESLYVFGSTLRLNNVESQIEKGQLSHHLWEQALRRQWHARLDLSMVDVMYEYGYVINRQADEPPHLLVYHTPIKSIQRNCARIPLGLRTTLGERDAQAEQVRVSLL